MSIGGAGLELKGLAIMDEGLVQFAEASERQSEVKLGSRVARIVVEQETVELRGVLQIPPLVILHGQGKKIGFGGHVE
jgi:hypothetical protein